VLGAVFAIYVHNLDPVIFELGRLALRWYGLAYLMGFLAGFWLLRHLAQRGLWVMAPEKTADFIAAAALLGVFLGGRLGYILFYHIPREGIGSVLADPLLVVRVWEGGMASHGGILGLVILTWFYSRKHRVSWTGLGDGLCVVAPVGLFFGRMANFINGELYGRVGQGIAWAMKFPTALADPKAPECERLEQAAAAAADVEPALVPAWQALETARLKLEMGSMESGYEFARSRMFGELLSANRDSGAVSDAIAPYLEPRHPSQLYEAGLEGLALFGILWWVRVRFPKAPHGTLTGLFFGFYAVFRIFAEQFREPDAAWVIEGLLTKGQFLSLFMLLFAAGFLCYAWLGRKRMAGVANP
jgi:phosphatidylglycerol:prolipoprotein diacylglycerol transferase